MKKLYIVLLASVLFLSCSDDEPAVVQGTPMASIGNITYDIGAITSTSVTIEFTAIDFTSDGSQFKLEIWHKKPADSDWTIKDITNAASESEHLVDGLELATKYVIKPVFTIGELVKEGAETSITTLPFKSIERKDFIFEEILLLSNDTSVDFQAFESEPSFYLKYANDSIQMTYTAISKDSLLIAFQANNSLFFEGNEGYVEKVDTSISFQFKDYYEEDWKTMEIFNRQPKIESLVSQNVVTCTDLDHTKLRFDGLFWNARASLDILLEADEYTISIKNVQDPAISTPVFTKSDFIENVAEACETGFDILLELPVQNRFHSGSSLWISFPMNLLPEGNYQLHFSAFKNDETHTAEPLEFVLSYE